MKYGQYIASPAWREKRQQRLNLDGYRCVVCKGDGSEYQLEVHHITYEHFGDEDVLHDLITVCSRCHTLFTEVQRRDKYERRAVSLSVDINESLVNQRKGYDRGMENSSLQIDIRLSDARPLRADCRSTQQVLEDAEGNIWQAQEN